MKGFLDAEHAASDGWIRANWPNEVMNLPKTGSVEVLSLDHYLGDDERGIGYDVILWIEGKVALHRLLPPLILIHSASPPAAQRMRAGTNSVLWLASKAVAKLGSSMRGNDNGGK